MNPNPAEMQAALLAWYHGHGREMPIRETRDPYAIWISEIMLQQTTVAAALPYWHRFLQRFPTVRDLAAAPAEDVLHAWAGLGYYSRARNLHRAAREIVQRFDGAFPTRFEDVLSLPGIGRYTAGAICSFAFDADVPAVDANAARVLARLFAIEGDPRSPAASRAIWHAAEQVLPHGHARDWNLAMFDLGAAVCTPGVPRCLACPVSAWCRAYEQGRQEELGQPAPRAPMAAETHVAAVIRDEAERVLMVQRPPEGVWAGMWEVPRGVLHEGEGEEDGLRRVAHERLGVEVSVGPAAATVRHTVMRRAITLRAREASIVSGIVPGEARWVAPSEAGALPLPSPQRRLLAMLTGEAR